MPKKTPKLFFSDIGVMRIDRLENDKKVNNSQRLSHKNWKVGEHTQSIDYAACAWRPEDILGEYQIIAYIIDSTIMWR